MIRAYVNRTGNGPPCVVELWDAEGTECISRSLCRSVQFNGTVTLRSVRAGSGQGFAALGGYVHSWVQSDADDVAAIEEALPVALGERFRPLPPPPEQA